MDENVILNHKENNISTEALVAWNVDELIEQNEKNNDHGICLKKYIIVSYIMR